MITVIKKARIVYDYTIEFEDGFKWDRDDLYETLSEIRNADDIIITNEQLGKWLLDKKILSSLGSSRWCSGATEGPEFDKFYEMICNVYHNSDL